MDAKHQFKYTYNETDLEEFSPLEVTFEVPGDATLQQMLYNFERYLQAAGFVFSGKLDFVEDTYPEYLDELDGTLYEFKDEEPSYGCMADFDKECGCPVGSKGEEGPVGVKEWNKGIAELDKEVKEQREIREKASLRADELKQMEERWKKISNEEKASILAEVLKASGL